MITHMLCNAPDVRNGSERFVKRQKARAAAMSGFPSKDDKKGVDWLEVLSLLFPFNLDCGRTFLLATPTRRFVAFRRHGPQKIHEHLHCGSPEEGSGRLWKMCIVPSVNHTLDTRVAPRSVMANCFDSSFCRKLGSFGHIEAATLSPSPQLYVLY